MPDIVIYSGPGCPNCIRTMNYLDREGIAYSTVDVDENPHAIEELKACGHAQLPVVFADGLPPFSGMRPDMLVRLKSMTQQTAARAS